MPILHANKVWKLINMENNVSDEQKSCLGTNLKHKVIQRLSKWNTCGMHILFLLFSPDNLHLGYSVYNLKKQVKTYL
jgi:hypothetical protein